MCATISRSEAAASAVATEPLRRWADGAAEIGLTRRGDRTRLRHLYQSDPCRVLFPNAAPGEPMQAVIVTTSGGIVGGDRIRIAVRADAGTAATLTTQAAEKIYRSMGSESEIDINIAVAADAVLEWMPQETILYDGSRLRRRIAIDAATGARLIAGEITVFGRRAHGEEYAHGLFHDAWRIVRDGRLAWADALHLEGDAASVLARPTAFDGAAATATFVYVSDDAGHALAPARSLLDTTVAACRYGATCIDGVLIARFLAETPSALRASYGRFWAAFRADILGLPASLPRTWET